MRNEGTTEMGTTNTRNSPNAGAFVRGPKYAGALVAAVTALLASDARAQPLPGGFPLELRPGAPKPWEDAVFWTPGAEFGFSPSGNVQNRIPLFSWQMPGGSAPIAVTLFHNSADSTRQRGVGFGFRVGPAAALVEGSDGTVTIEAADGTSFVFTPDGSGGFVSEPGFRDRLLARGAQYVLRCQGGFERVFENPRSLGFVETSWRDRNSNTVTFGYDSLNRLTSITDSVGRAATLTRSGGLLREVRSPLGTRFSLTYLGGELVEVAGPTIGGQVPRVAITYDRLVHTIVRRTSWGGGHLSSFAYFPNRRLRIAGPAEGNAFVVTYAPGQVAVTDTMFETTTAKYADGAVVEVITPGGERISYARDERRRVVEVRDSRGDLTSFAYDDHDNIIAVVDELGNLSSFVYDERHNLLQATDRLGLTRSFTYNSLDEVTRRTTSLGETTTYNYDASGNLVSVVDFMGVTRFQATYDAFGNTLTTTNESGSTWRYSYDGFGNLVSASEPDLLRTTTQEVTPLGQPTSITDALGATTTYAYDALNRPIRAEASGGGFIAVDWDLDGRITRVDNRAGAVAQDMTQSYAGKASVARAFVNGVELQTAAAAAAIEPLLPEGAPCEPSCGLRCGAGISDTCGGSIDCTCPPGLSCNPTGFCER